MAYRAEIEIGVKGGRELSALQDKVERLTQALDAINTSRFSVAQRVNKLTSFQVAQEQKLILQRQKFNDELRESVRLAVEFQQRIEASIRAARSSRAVSSRTLTGSTPAGLITGSPERKALPAAGGTGAGARAFERAVAKAAKIDAFFAQAAEFLRDVDRQIEQQSNAIRQTRVSVSKGISQPFGLLPPAQTAGSPVQQEVTAAKTVQNTLTKNLQIQKNIKELKVEGVRLDKQLNELTRAKLAAEGDELDILNRQIAQTRQLRRENTTFIKELQQSLQELPAGGFVRGAASPLKGDQQLNANIRERTRLEESLTNFKLQGFKVTAAETALEKLDLSLNRKNLNTTKVELDLQKRLLKDLKEELRLVRQISDNRKGGLDNRTGLQKAKDATGSALIGGAFPLLFGQGPGAALGGALGGGAGGLIGGQFGFGLSLVGTQFGVLFDQLASGAATLGQALNTLTADIDAVVAAAGKSNTVFSQNIKALEEAGLKNTALALATKELSTVVGGRGVNALQQFGNDTQKLGQTFTQLMTQMQADLALLANSLGILRSVIGGLEDAVLFRQAKESQDPRVALARAQLTAAEKQVDFSSPTNKFVKLEQLRARVIAAQRQVNKEEAANIENLSKQALAEKNNLDTAKQNLQNLERSFTVSDTANKITEQQKKRQQEQLNFESRRNEIVTNYEKSIAALRRTVEDQISNLRLQNLKKANQLEDQRAANALATFRNQQAAARLFTVGSSPQDPALRATAESLRDAADAYNLKILETEQKRAKLERDSALTIEEIQFRADKFKLDVARQAAELSLNAQKQIDKINKTIVERNSKFELEKFRNEIKLAALQLQVLRAETRFEISKVNDQLRTAVGPEADVLNRNKEFLEATENIIKSNIERIKKEPEPKVFTQVSGLADAGIDLTGYTKLVKEEIAITKQLKESRLDALNIEAQEAGFARLSASAQALQKIENEATNALFARNIELEKSARLSELTRELGSQALAQEITNIEFATRAQQAQIELRERDLLAQQQLLEIKVAEGKANQTEIDQLEHIKQLLIETNKLKGVVNTASESLKTGAKGEIQQFVEQATNELNNLEAVAVRVSQGIGNAIGNSLANGISSLIEGSATVKEVFADMLKSIGQILVQEGTKMIATYIAIGIAKAFAGLSGGPSASSGAQMSNTQYFNPMTGLGVAGPNFGLANGGAAKAGQPYMVGERGPELFVPSTNGGVLRNEDLRSAMSRQRSNAPALNFSFETTNIGGTEYVSREQLEAAMAVTRKQAASDGAKRGMNMTLDKMQHSPATRRRVGI